MTSCGASSHERTSDVLVLLRIGGVLMGTVAGVPGAASLTDNVCASAPLGDVRVSRAVLAALHAVVTRRELPSKPSDRRCFHAGTVPQPV